MNPHLIEAGALFGSGAVFGIGAGVLATILIMDAHQRRVREARRRRKEEQALADLAIQATKPIYFGPIMGEVSPNLDERAAWRIAELKASGELAKVEAEHKEWVNGKPDNSPQAAIRQAVKDKIAITPGTPVTAILDKPVQVLVARHRQPTRSPLANLNVSLTAGEDGWQVEKAKFDPVTQTDLLNLKAIRDLEPQET